MCPTAAAKESMLETAVNAAAAGHDLTAFEPVEDANGNANGYQARCRRCDMTNWVGERGERLSLLEDRCSKA